MDTALGLLDHGYLKLIETWGSDERIIEAARMSTGKGFQGWGPKYRCKGCQVEEIVTGGIGHITHTKECSDNVVEKVSGDEKLLATLYNHKHSTPFEMAGLIIEVKAPIFVFREWHRHRTQCLIGGTKITLVTPNGTTFKRTIKEIFDLKHGGVIDTPPEVTKNGVSKNGTRVYRAARRKNAWRVRVLPNCQTRLLRVLDENTGLFHVAKMKDVWESGTKKVYQVIAGNYRVIASAEHPFFTQRGWIKTKELEIGDHIARMGKVATDGPPLPPSLRAGIGVWTSMMRNRLIGEVATCYKCEGTFPKKEIDLDHVVPVIDDLKLALDETNLKPICISCHLEKSALEQPDRREQTRRGVRWEKVERLPILVGEHPTYDLEVEGPHHNYCANDLVVHNSYNEMSARYIPLPDENYIPSVKRLMMQGGTNKQAQSTGAVLTKEAAILFQKTLSATYKVAQDTYTVALQAGVPKELARLPVPVARYSCMRASANLRNWLQFLTLRMNTAAQWEIRQYANAVGKIIEWKFPHTWALFAKGL